MTIQKILKARQWGHVCGSIVILYSNMTTISLCVSKHTVTEPKELRSKKDQPYYLRKSTWLSKVKLEYER